MDNEDFGLGYAMMLVFTQLRIYPLWNLRNYVP